MRFVDKPEGEPLAVFEARGDVYVTTKQRVYRKLHGEQDFKIVNFEASAASGKFEPKPKDE